METEGSDDEQNEALNLLKQRNLDAIFDKDVYGGDRNPFQTKLLVNRNNTNKVKSKFIDQLESSKHSNQNNEEDNKSPLE
jgi:hypothetical protein